MKFSFYKNTHLAYARSEYVNGETVYWEQVAGISNMISKRRFENLLAKHIGSFTVRSDAETVNKSYTLLKIDLDTMLYNGECEPNDEIIFHVNGLNVEGYFKNGGHLFDPGKDAELALALAESRMDLEIYQ